MAAVLSAQAGATQPSIANSAFALYNGVQQMSGTEEYIATFFVRALYDYQSTDPSSLSFRRNDIIEVLSRLESGWWDGLLGDERGWFPSNYVEVLTTQEAEASLGGSEYSFIAPPEAQESTVDMAEAMGVEMRSEQDSDWVDAGAASQASFADAPVQPRAGKTAADFWVPQVTADGQIFYVNTKTGQHSRDLPEEGHEDTDSDVAGLTSQASSRSGSSAALGLKAADVPEAEEAAGFGVPRRTGTPEPWVKRLADDGMTYYYLNKLDGQMRWTLPDATEANGTQPEAMSSVSSLTGQLSINGRAGMERMRSDSALSIPRDISRAAGDRLSVYSDDSEIHPLVPENGVSATPLQRSIAQARQNGTLELTSAEQAAENLQRTMAPPAPQTVSDLSATVRGVVASLIDYARAGGTVNLPEHDAQMNALVGAVVVAVRDLLYISALPSGAIPPGLIPGDTTAPTTSSLQTQLKPAQRKVTATLSKLVLSVRAVHYDSEMQQADAPGRIEADATELDRALQAFVMDVQRYHRHSRISMKRVRGAFSPDYIGLGLVGAGAAASWKGFGWVALNDMEETPSKTLGSEVADELSHVVGELMKQLVHFTEVLKSSTEDLTIRVVVHARDIIRDFTSFLRLVADIHIARHVDIDGIQQERGQSPAHDLYMKTVEKARLLVRTLESVVQSIYDDSASLLSTTQTVRQAELDQSSADRETSFACLGALAGTLKDNAASVLQTIEALLAIGRDQADMALGDYSGSIEWRMSRVSMIESALRPLSLGPGANADIVDMELAFKPAGPKLQQQAVSVGPLQRQTSERSLSPSDRSHSGNEDLPATPTWNGTDTSLDDSVRPASPTLESTMVDEDEAGAGFDEEAAASSKSPPRGKKLMWLIGPDAPTHYLDAVNVDAKPWYLRPSLNTGDIVIDQADGAVKGGTVPALVERLTTHESPDTKFTKTFFMTWKSFTTLDELFDLLVSRYRLQSPDGLKQNELEEWTKLKQHVVRTRVLNTFKTMIMDDDDVLDKEDLYILEKMKGFVSSDQVSALPAAKQLLVWIDRAQNGDASLKKMHVNNQPPPPSIIPRSLNSKKLKVLDIDPLELARQMTLYESQLFCKIRPMECILRSRDQRAGKVDHIAALIQTTNQIASWVADCILSKEDSRRRAAVVKHFINVADRCRLLHNFSTMVAIVSGLNGPAIRRLKRTWEQVNARTMAQLGACEQTFDTDRGFSNYRATLAKVSPPCVPFFGVYLTTLTFIQDGNPDNLNGNLVNFSKRHMAAEVINDIKRWQAKPYSLLPIQPVLVYVEESLNQYNDAEAALRDQWWNISLEREPREREDEKMARLLQESGFL